MAESASSSANDTDFVITIDDTSPVLTYSPPVDPSGTFNLTAGWNPFYSVSGPTPDPATGEGNGTSLHVTSATGASLSLRWNGTAVALYGSFSSSSSGMPSTVPYSVSLDGTATTNYNSHLSENSDPATGTLASFTNLTNGEHTVELTMHTLDDGDDTTVLQFDRAVISSALPDQSIEQSSNITLATDTLADKSISFRGQWSFNSNLLPGQDVPFHTSTNLGDLASVSFNGTSVTLAGLTTPHSGSYNISLDNSPPETFSARSSFNLSSPTILFFRTGLDPAIAHQLDIVNAGSPPSEQDQGTLLIIGSVNVTTVAQNSSGANPTGNMSSSSLTKGTIAALVIGIVLATAAFVALSACYIRRRRRDQQRKQGFIVNPRVSSRRLSFMRLPRRSQVVDPEKAHHKDDPSHGPDDADIVDISGRKEEDDEEEEQHETSMLQVPRPDQGSRHGSQNSDGSYSISLPELPGRGHVRVRSDDDPPPSTQRYTAESPNPRIPSPLHSPLIVNIHPSSPRSPKPRGPREMRSSTFATMREGPQGILLKELHSPAVDAPVGVQEDGRLTTTGPHASASQPATPLRVNFDDADVRPNRRSRSRSAVSGISLPASLRQAFAWAQGLSSQGTPEPPTPQTHDADPRSLARYSFLDMESSASHSHSSGSRSTRNSHSTRASSKSRHGAEASGSNGQGSSDVPPVPSGHRVSLGLSMVIAGGPTSSQPSLSPDISLQAVPLPPLSVPSHAHGGGGADVPQSVHPTDLAELLPSPTDSIPLTVSDIHFRHSTQSNTSASDAGNGSGSGAHGHARDRLGAPAAHRTAHPPLPSTPATPAHPPPAQDERPYIVQKLVGSPSAGPGPATPYGTPRPPSGPRASSSASLARRGESAGPSFASVMAGAAGPIMSRRSAPREAGPSSPR